MLAFLNRFRRAKPETAAVKPVASLAAAAHEIAFRVNNGAIVDTTTGDLIVVAVWTQKRRYPILPQEGLYINPGSFQISEGAQSVTVMGLIHNRDTPGTISTITTSPVKSFEFADGTVRVPVRSEKTSGNKPYTVVYTLPSGPSPAG